MQGGCHEKRRMPHNMSSNGISGDGTKRPKAKWLGRTNAYEMHGTELSGKKKLEIADPKSM